MAFFCNFIKKFMFGYRFSFLMFLCCQLLVFSQDNQSDLPFSKPDLSFREDQFYIGISIFNRLQNTPVGFVQNGFPVGVSLGFLRDMPINKKRTLAFAAGFGFAYNKFYQNIRVFDVGGITNVQIVDNDSFSLNKMEQIYIEFPIEFRWRNATPTNHKFYRIYSGFKWQFMIFDKTKFVSESATNVVFSNSTFNKLQFGPTFSIGHNTWNASVFYGLNGMFKKTNDLVQVEGLNTLNMGLMFYIL